MKKPKKKKAKVKNSAAMAANFTSAPGTSGTVADLAMRGQEESNWCWAAVTQTCVQLLKHQSPSQEDIVSGHIQRTGRTYSCSGTNRTREEQGSCTRNSCTASCNDPHSIQLGLEGHQIRVQLLSNNAIPRFADIQQQVQAQRPVPCQVLWSDGTEHIILIVGWSANAGVQAVQILDPQDAPAGVPIGTRSVPHASLLGSYVQVRTGKIGSVRFSYAVS